MSKLDADIANIKAKRDVDISDANNEIIINLMNTGMDFEDAKKKAEEATKEGIKQADELIKSAETSSDSLQKK